jgi:prolyl-tRNA synthetase
MVLAHKKAQLIEWLDEVAHKAGLAEHSFVSGTTVIRPYGFEIWEHIQQVLDKRFKARGVKNASFPLFIPEKLLTKEAEHVKGFAPEVAWVTHGGNSKLDERIAVRPTSETIMYAHYSNWVRSWRDLPLKINQWCNVVRWEFKHPRLFLRGREFLWQEGHPVFATQKEAEADVLDALEDYRHTYEDVLAIPVTLGKKTEEEKFPGAVYTTAAEIMMPDGKLIQGCTSHYLGQNFAKSFGIEFLDKDKKKKFAHQNSWGLSTRSIGILIAVHGDDRGLILPPKVAPIQAVVVPIYDDSTKDEVLKVANRIATHLQNANIRYYLDDRDEYSPGWKFNEWELKGVPVRVEVGPKDIKVGKAILVRRDTGQRSAGQFDEIGKVVHEELEQMQKSLFEKAGKFAEEHTKEAKKFDDLKKFVTNNRVLVAWCMNPKCEERFRELGAKTSCMPFKQSAKGECIACGQKAKAMVYVAKSY